MGQNCGYVISRMLENNQERWWRITMGFNLPYWYYPERMPPSSLWLWERFEDDDLGLSMDAVGVDEVDLNAMD